MSRKPHGRNQQTVTALFPSLPSVKEIGQRLALIFPESFPNRSILVGEMAARVIFVFLYGGFVEGQKRFLRPSYVYFFTEKQANMKTDAERYSWLSVANKPGNRPKGKRWYADNSREQIRDDLMRNQLLRLGIIQKLSGQAITSSAPSHFLSSDFAALFNPGLRDKAFAAAAYEWRTKHLDPATLQRMVLRSQGIQANVGDVLIEMPDGTRIRKGLIEDFTKHHMEKPAVLWLSASDKKAYPQFVQLAATVGLKFSLNAELPDLILADLGEPARFLFCEVVATDGAITETRKQALLAIMLTSNIPTSAAQFLSAFEDREAPAFRKNFSQLALDSLVWFRTEPNLLVLLSTANRAAIDPNK